ncbi:MAG: LuxR C-terminal-related transcriptional regulator [Adhaeribacter sp.]
MEATRKPFTTAAELYQFWSQQPFGGSQESLPETLAEDFEQALYLYAQDQQFVYVYDYQTARVVYVSRNLTQVLGYSQEEFSIEFLYSKIHPQDHDQVLKISRATGDLVMQCKELAPLMAFLTVDFRLMHADGHYIKMQRQSTILKRDESGNVHFSVGIITDINHLNRSDKVSFDVSMPEYKEMLVQILESYEPGTAAGEFSVREKQVLRLMALGKNTRQIAQELSLSTFTVDTHRKNMKKKLMVRNTAGLISEAFKRKLI